MQIVTRSNKREASRRSRNSSTANSPEHEKKPRGLCHSTQGRQAKSEDTLGRSKTDLIDGDDLERAAGSFVDKSDKLGIDGTEQRVPGDLGDLNRRELRRDDGERLTLTSAIQFSCLI